MVLIQQTVAVYVHLLVKNSIVILRTWVDFEYRFSFLENFNYSLYSFSLCWVTLSICTGALAVGRVCVALVYIYCYTVNTSDLNELN